MRTISLSQGKEAIVDDSDYDWLSEKIWIAHFMPEMNKFRAVTRRGGGTTYMSRLIMGLESGDKRRVDHRNGDTLDNRRENLRVATQSQNGMNRGKTRRCPTEFKGVRQHHRQWLAQIAENGRHHYLGLYKTPEDAAKAYDEAAIKYHGEFAVLNFPQEGHNVAI